MIGKRSHQHYGRDRCRRPQSCRVRIVPLHTLASLNEDAWMTTAVSRNAASDFGALAFACAILRVCLRGCCFALVEEGPESPNGNMHSGVAIATPTPKVLQELI